ncbi:ribitol 5-phosphate transferase FKRP [Patella vulgata]|uniref:ribitol 5-phosphate transferase FKRP n=1 Tax=Patella vulgata TaxID=6465 RepID=UPI00217FF2C8|nr:ribitol 5-phosphate transferase FKRP [Patella vulgata]
MRINKCKVYIISALLLNLFMIIYFVILQHKDLKMIPDNIQRLTRQELTVIIREHEEFENNLENTINKLYALSDRMDIVVISDKIPYPPIKHTPSDRITFISLEPTIKKSILTTRPERFIRSDFMLFLPDSTSMSSWYDIQQAIDLLIKSPKLYSAIVLPVSPSQVNCQKLKFDVKKWTVIYTDSESKCDMVIGNHGILTKTENILEFTDPFIRPLHLSFYIQNSLNDYPVLIYDKTVLSSLRMLFSEPHNSWKHKKLEDQRRQNLFKNLGIKLIKHSNGHEEWFGCSKHTARCFDTVVNDMPEYLYLGRWTPPCCHKALKETVHHVFKILSDCGARFWLEGGSLLGAAREGDIIPWDYDVDIGIYKDDLSKCEQFKIDAKNAIIDEDGFVWEKAVEGEFYRVQYSESNRLHVDIFPFYSKNGTMTKNTWMKTHRQDTEFPESFLKPLTKIQFVGLDAPAPNNVKKFLEYKFGKGVIENPKYPNSQDPHS